MYGFRLKSLMICRINQVTTVDNQAMETQTDVKTIANLPDVVLEEIFSFLGPK